ncbi:uncharacterized protein LOC119395975 [Rhipicephalus sanguineus]|uniref:uncharacterized protein LOC119395975 n=1 Tax=Rhipicephalus sanguineus TaxID=34632 RepID=UPI001895C2B9|nr:uncharacterized protein LOC119395975 [Rhipicephalus sanguineus]
MHIPAFSRNAIFCALVLAPMHFGNQPDSYDERCGPVFSSQRRFGAKHLSKMSAGAKEAIMKCRNITERSALQRDAEFEQRRRMCIGLFFPTVPEEKLEEHLCRFTRMDDSDDVQKLRNITACLKKGHETFGKDERQVLELRASRIECMQKFFDDAPRGIRDRKYANLVKRVRALADGVMDTNRQVMVCMRHYEAPEEELHERNKAKDLCMKRILPDVPQERLESVFLANMKNRSAYMDDALQLCTFMETPTGKWAKEELIIYYKCVREMLLHVPSAVRASASFRLGLDVEEENIDKMLRCEAKGGTHVLFEGIQRPEFLRCLSGRRERPHITEMFDSSTVYDNPDPHQKLKLCTMHKRASNEAFMEYRQYRTMVEKEQKRLEACYNHHLGRPLEPTTISGSEESNVATETSVEGGSEAPTDQPPTTVASQENEFLSTVALTAAAIGEDVTVKSD